MAKVCSSCKQDKSLEEFDVCRIIDDKKYYRRYCSDCRKEIGKTKYFNDRERQRRKSQKSYAKHREKHRENARNKFRNKTKDVYFAFLEKQNYVCAICRKPETAKRNGRIKDMALDHCHETGKYRGVLCQNCNTTLGHIKDDIEILKKMIEYLS